MLLTLEEKEEEDIFVWGTLLNQLPERFRFFPLSFCSFFDEIGILTLSFFMAYLKPFAKFPQNEIGIKWNECECNGPKESHDGVYV